MAAARRRRAGGFVLAELLVAMVIAAIIGVALTQLVISQSRFVALQGGIMQSRGGARAALNVMARDLRMVTDSGLVARDLRMVTDSGLVAASPESVTVRVPYAFGVSCNQLMGKTVVSLLPSDSAAYYSATLSGYGWRDSTGKYVYVQPATASSSFAFFCGLILYTNPPVWTLWAPAWAPTAVALAPNDVRTPAGSVVYLYQLVRYAFAPSGQLPGRIGLWRTLLTTSQRDELVAPFDSTARFLFLDSTLTAHATPPGNLNTVKGLRLVLVAASELPPEGRTAPMQFSLTTDVVFRNHP